MSYFKLSHFKLSHFSISPNNANANTFCHPLIVFLLAITCCIMWGSAFPCVKIGYALFNITDYGSQILFAGYRFTLAGIMTYIISSILENKLVTIKAAATPYVFAQGILQTTIQYVFFYIGLANTTGTKASVINGSSTFFSILLASLLFCNERLTLRKILGCLIGFTGVIAVNLHSGLTGFNSDFTLVGEGFILICSMAYGFSSATYKLIADKASATAITAFQLMFGGIVLIIIGLLAGGHVTGFTLESTALLVYLSTLSAVAFSLWATLLKYNPVSRIAIFGFSIPVFGVLLSGLLINETIFSISNLIALILVSTGIIIVNRQ